MNDSLTILLDMDGVLANFDKKIIELTGSTTAAVNKKDMWDAITEYNITGNFFGSLEVMPGAVELSKFVIANFTRYGVLTATGKESHNSAAQKIRWIKKHFPLLSGSVITVANGVDKKQYATPTTLLIDDRSICTVPFVQAGGLAIVYNGVNDAILLLEMFIDS